MTRVEPGRLAGKVALITGAASGIGLATLRLFLAEGACVLATDRAANASEPATGRLALLVQDAADPDAWPSAVAAAETLFGGLDILVNCAGINPGAHPAARQQLDQITLADWRYVQSINADGMLLGCQQALPRLRTDGAIVNVASVAGAVAMPDAMAYGVSKAAVAHLTKSVALLAARQGRGVRANSVHPGPILTPTMKPGAGRTPQSVPLGRFGEAAEVAAAILFLASDDAAYVTGAELFVDGGLSAL